jgi:hypothetical protein
VVKNWKKTSSWLVEKQRAGHQIQIMDKELFLNVARDQRVKMAMQQDAVMGVVIAACEKHAPQNETIASYVSALQYNCVEWQTERLANSSDDKCVMCEKLLPYLQGFNCSRCQHVYYCSRECQSVHWKEHKSQCRDVDNDGKNKTSKESGKTSKEEIENKPECATRKREDGEVQASNDKLTQHLKICRQSSKIPSRCYCTLVLYLRRRTRAVYSSYAS